MQVHQCSSVEILEDSQLCCYCESERNYRAPGLLLCVCEDSQPPPTARQLDQFLANVDSKKPENEADSEESDCPGEP